METLAIWRPSQSPTQPTVTSALRMECCQLSYQGSTQGVVITCVLQFRRRTQILVGIYGTLLLTSNSTVVLMWVMLAEIRPGNVHGGKFGRNVPWELDVNQKRWRALAGGVSRRALHLAVHPLQLAASPINDPVFNDQTCRPSPPLSPCLHSPS